MRKGLLALGIVAALATTASADKFPFSDDFESGLKADWATDSAAIAHAFSGNGTLSAVTSATDCRGTAISAPTGSTTFAQLARENTAAGTSIRVVGDGDETDYVVEADIYVPVVNVSGPDADYYQDYWYQSVVCNTTSTGYYDLHFQYNTGASHGGRIRFRNNGTSLIAKNSADFPSGVTVTEGWKHVTLALDHTNGQAECFVDGVDLWSGAQSVTETSFAAGGAAGFGGYVDGIPTGQTAVDVATYIDNFEVTTASSVSHWSVYEEALTE